MHTSSNFRSRAARSSRAGLRGLGSALLSVVLLATAACSDAPTSAPASPSLRAPSRAVAAAEASSALLECSYSQAKSARRLITPAGGVLAVGGHAIAIPRGAVSRPTEITMSVPASRYVEVDIIATGHEHFQFKRPVVITLDYSRCGDAADDLLASFTAWYIDQPTRLFRADMGGVDDRLFRRIFFTTDHLSGYAVAYRTSPQPPADDAQLEQ